ncbi:1-aminocyclopropane-1-carboxylate synthase [Melia azedarach]|uniref:1-aminocyclopropane-1-carboxylate synthase n=1 Tax=Melia azedarach TaxID=155640 RepID=A0ACC1YXY9_MELAZ|nr:1-aminocyclopropane-1-carboxylate synthase [Melia azedarach]
MGKPIKRKLARKINISLFLTTTMGILSKIATNDGHGENTPYFDGWKAFNRNPFHPTQNPEGVIQLGLAENQLCFDLIKNWITKNPEASICTPEGVEDFKDIANFQDYHGLPEFRQAVAKFMGKARGGRATFEPDRIVMGGGATGANELIMFCLADPGDAFLVPSPYYAAFNRDPRMAHWSKTSSSSLRQLEQFRTTVFKSPKFVSVAEVIEEMDCNRDLIHIIYSLSKDMGLPGFRVGIVYSYNDAVVNCGRKMSSFGLVSSQTQYLLASMLSDEEFVDNFIAESSKRLAKRHHTFTKGLEQVGINCLKSNAGLFFWMDLRHLLKEQTFEGEIALWRKIINDVKLNVSPGCAFECKEPGWFRVCFANIDDDTVQVTLKRIGAFVRQGKEDEKPTKKRWQQNLRLSFSSRMYEQGVMSPHMLSPHSPIPQSPLVRART